MIKKYAEMFADVGIDLKKLRKHMEESLKKGTPVMPQASRDILEYWHAIPGSKLGPMTLSGLRKYWRHDPAPNLKKGMCPNCLRYMFSPGWGVCNTCYKSSFDDDGNKLMGWPLLIALRKKAEVLNPSGDPAEPLPGEDDDEPIEKAKIVGTVELPADPDPGGLNSDFGKKLQKEWQEKKSATPAMIETGDIETEIVADGEEDPPELAPVEPAEPTAPVIRQAVIVTFADEELELRVANGVLDLTIREPNGGVMYELPTLTGDALAAVQSALNMTAR